MSKDFKDLFERYKKGNVSDAERQTVEAEIEKNMMINEYVADSIDDQFLGIDSKENTTMEEESINNEIDQVKKAMSRRFKKIVGVSTASVLIILLLLFNVVSPLMSKMYYDPTSVSQGEYHKDLFFDMRVFTELTIPGYAYSLGMTDDLGFAKYDLYMVQNNLFTNVSENTKGHINKGKRIGMYEDFFMRYYYFYNDFGSSRKMEEEIKDFIDMTNREAMDELNSISKTAYVALFVNFDEDISLLDFETMKQEYRSYSNDGLEFKWMGVRIDDESKINDIRLGFNPNLNDGSSTADRPDPEKYPYLALIDYMDESILMEKYGTYEGYMANGYEVHFKSMLKYLIDRPEFTHMLYYTDSINEDYKNALSYVENNGVKTYGGLIYGTAEDLLIFIENEKVKNVIIDDVKVSKYSR